MALGFWEEQRIPLEKTECSHCREGRAQQFGFGIISRGAVYDHAACRSACGICPTPLSSTEQFKTHLTERQRACRKKVTVSFMKTGMGRAEITCKRSLQCCHSGRVLGTSSLLTSHRRTHTRGTPGTSPQPTQNVYAPRTRALALFE